MRNFNWVNNRLASSGAIEGKSDIPDLENMGITDVVDLRAEFDDAPLFRSSEKIHYLYNGTADDGKPKPITWFEKSLDFALAALSKPGRKVLVHCQAGEHRAPSTAYAILRAQGLTKKQAMRLIDKNVKRADPIYAGQADEAVDQLGYE